MSRPKKMLPVLGQEPTGGVAAPSVGTATREERRGHAPSVDGSERTVVRVEGMDCASCAVTVERRVAVLPGVHRATVNFAAGRLDAEHVTGLRVEEIERAVRAAGFEVSEPGETDGTPFWRTPRALSTVAAALLFLAGLILGLAGAPDVARVGVYLAAIVVGGLPIFRAALSGLRARHLDMNVLMSIATIGAVGIGSGRRPLRSWCSSPPATRFRSTL